MSSKQVAPPSAVRCRSGGGLLLVLVAATVAGQGAADAVERFGVVLFISLLVGAALLVAGEVIERQREAGTVTSLKARVMDSEIASYDDRSIPLARPRSRTIDIRDQTAVRRERQPLQPVDETRAIRLPRKN